MKPRAVCTVMDRNYLTRGLALYTSLRLHGPAYDLHVLCMDHETWDTLSRLAPEGLKPVALESVMNHRLKRASEDRTLKEFSITCKSFFMFWLLQRHPELELLTFADSDMFFYSDPEAVFAELGTGSVGITEHRFPARLEPGNISRSRGLQRRLGLGASRYSGNGVRRRLVQSMSGLVL